MTTIYELNSALSTYSDITEGVKVKHKPSFWKPFHVCLLTMAMLERAKSKNFNPSSFRINGLGEDETRYLSRMHLWQCLDADPPIKVSERDSTGRFMPLMRLTDRDVIPKLSSKLDIMMQNSPTGSTDGEKTMLDELLDNCFAHSEVDDGMYGLVCAQHWPKKNKSQISILDRGIGIRGSLLKSEEHVQILKTRNSCEYATEYQVSSKLGRGHAGYGLTLARGLIQNNGGLFFLASGGEYYFSKGGHAESGSLKTPFQGTLIVLEWNTLVSLDSSVVYDSWPSEELDYDFDF